jgi:hypothetical protein
MPVLLLLTTVALSSALCASAADHKAMFTAIMRHDHVIGTVYPVTIVGNYADAGVSRASGLTSESVLLVKKNGSWKVLAAGGRAYSAGSMQHYGIPAATATKLARMVQQGVCTAPD